MRKRIYSLLLLAGFFISKSEAQQGSIFDPAISYGINGKIKESIGKHSFAKSEIAKGYIEIKSYEDDSLIYDSYGKNIDIALNRDPIFRNETLLIILSAPKDFQIVLAITNDSCSIELQAVELIVEDKTYKSDSSIIKKTFPCRQKTLTLVNKPVFKAGEFIEGVIELVSEDYRKLKAIDDKKCRFQMRAYFKIKIPIQKDN
jgi:hypothetical protein